MSEASLRGISALISSTVPIMRDAALSISASRSSAVPISESIIKPSPENTGESMSVSAPSSFI